MYLPDEAVHVSVAEVLRQYDFLKLIDILDDEFGATGRPKYDLVELRVLYWLGRVR